MKAISLIDAFPAANEATSVGTVAPELHAADILGMWKGGIQFPGRNIPRAIHLTKTGAALTGTVEGLRSGSAEIREGKVEGNVVTFWINTDYEGMSIKLLYKGTIAPSRIDFKFSTEDDSWAREMTTTKASR